MAVARLRRAMRFSGRHILVTGAASGLGLAIAQAAKAEGATVTGLDITSAPGVNICDVSDEAQVAAALAGLTRLDGVVNSAGMPLRTSVTDTDMDDYDRLMAVNLRGLFLVSKHALPLMRGHGGAMLHIASCVGV